MTKATATQVSGSAKNIVLYPFKDALTAASSDFLSGAIPVSRSTIAAGMLPNNLGNLSGWIADPQGIKPGNPMPNLYLSGPELQDIRAFLATLE